MQWECFKVFSMLISSYTLEPPCSTPNMRNKRLQGSKHGIGILLLDFTHLSLLQKAFLLQFKQPGSLSAGRVFTALICNFATGLLYLSIPSTKHMQRVSTLEIHSPNMCQAMYFMMVIVLGSRDTKTTSCSAAWCEKENLALTQRLPCVPLF